MRLDNNYTSFYQGSDISAREQFEQISSAFESVIFAIDGAFPSFNDFTIGSITAETLNASSNYVIVTKGPSNSPQTVIVNSGLTFLTSDFTGTTSSSLYYESAGTTIAGATVDVGSGHTAKIYNRAKTGIVLGGIRVAATGTTAEFGISDQTAAGSLVVGVAYPAAVGAIAKLLCEGAGCFVFGSVLPIVASATASVYLDSTSSGCFFRGIVQQGSVIISGLGQGLNLTLNGGSNAAAVNMSGNANNAFLNMQGATTSVVNITGTAAFVALNITGSSTQALGGTGITVLGGLTGGGCTNGSSANYAFIQGLFQNAGAFTNTGIAAFLHGRNSSTAGNLFNNTGIAAYMHGWLATGATADLINVANVGRAEGYIPGGNAITAGGAAIHYCAWAYGDSTLGVITANGGPNCVQFFPGVNGIPQSFGIGLAIRFVAPNPAPVGLAAPALAGVGPGCIWVNAAGDWVRWSAGTGILLF